jgi:hypothetical protein
MCEGCRNCEDDENKKQALLKQVPEGNDFLQSAKKDDVLLV